jgi:S-adenosylmethionine synthetase
MKTAECVAPGHPDKICDQIADAILDELLKQDPKSRCAIEVTGGHGNIFITGEVTTKAQVNFSEVAQKIYQEIGYLDKISIIEIISQQSKEIAQSVDIGGAGDQGIMIGYACQDNEAMIPQEVYLARQILQNLPKDFGPDAKSQVTLEADGIIDTIVISAMHSPNQDLAPLYQLAKKYQPQKIFINPTGSFSIGGFLADSGTTGRKIVIDAYSPNIPVGGSAFSGKDPTKVDRSGAYMTRKIAVDYVKKGGQKSFVKISLRYWSKPTNNGNC